MSSFFCEHPVAFRKFIEEAIKFLETEKLMDSIQTKAAIEQLEIHKNETCNVDKSLRTYLCAAHIASVVFVTLKNIPKGSSEQAVKEACRTKVGVEQLKAVAAAGGKWMCDKLK